MNSHAITMNHKGVIRAHDGVGGSSATGRRMLLLVHGYNNNPAEAAGSYFTLRRNLDTILSASGVGEPTRRRFQDDIWELYWPGYHPLTRASGRGLPRTFIETTASALSYSVGEKSS